MLTFNDGLVKSRDDHMSAACPDAGCVLECATVALATQNETPLARGVRKLSEFLSANANFAEKVQVQKTKRDLLN
jgi:hypothetical protein